MEANTPPVDNLSIIPVKERLRLRNKEIRLLYYKMGYSMEQISLKLNVSKTAIFYAIKGRDTGKKKVPNH